MNKKILGILLILITVSFILTSCSGSTSNNTTTSTTVDTAGKPQYGGILKIIEKSLFTNLGCPSGTTMNPQDAVFTVPCVEYLVRFDEKGLPIPWLATSWTLSSDLKSITFTLRKGVKFHDGSDFNAEAVKFNFDLYRQSPAPDFKIVTSIDIIDDYTVRFNLKEYQAHFFSLLTENSVSRIISPTAYKTYGCDWCMTHPVGTGPFKLVDFKRDVNFKYVKFDDYWQKGKPYLDGIEMLLIEDPVTALMAFKTGESHINNNMILLDASKLMNDKNYRVNMDVAFVFGLAGDSAHPESPFSDIRVRKAIEYAIDKDALVKGAFYGLTKSAGQIVPAGYWAYNPKVTGYPYDPDKAKQLLAEAGYPNGFKTKIILDTTMSQEAAAIEQNYLGKIGINAEIQSVTPSAYMQNRLKGWNNSLLTFTTSCQVGYDTGRSLASAICNSVANTSLACIEELKTQVAKANAEPDFVKRQVLMQDLVKMWHDQAYTNPVFVYLRYSAQNPKVNEARIHDPWGIQWTPENAWLSK